jgi:secreted trypsin-like serine protease
MRRDESLTLEFRSWLGIRLNPVRAPSAPNANASTIIVEPTSEPLAPNLSKTAAWAFCARPLARALGCLLALVVTLSAQAGDVPVTMTASGTNNVSLQTYGRPLDTKLSSDAISESVTGTESSQCQTYGRASRAVGASRVDIVKHDESWYTLTLTSDATAEGGHFRTCAKCAPYVNLCVGIFPNDTTGSSSAVASAVLTVAFDPEFRRASDYVLNVASSGQLPSMTLTEKSGTPVALHGPDGGPALLKGAPGNIYYLNISLPSTVSNTGGCCEDHKNGTATVDVRLSKAPILFAAYEIGYIKGGKQTNGYKNVGVILLNGEVHCTGTVVGKHTVLTAAHCLYGYDKNQMTFVLGANYQYPDPNGGPMPVSDATYPTGPDFKFNPKTYEDDVGLIYFTKPIAVQTASLPTSAPDWNSIVSQNTSLLFVGFGFNVIQGDTVGAGVKREGEWEINTVTNRTVAFAIPGKSTCYGDSGGPAFLETPAALVLAAITSGGDDACTEGTEMRVDAYSGWLNGKIT